MHALVHVRICCLFVAILVTSANCVLDFSKPSFFYSGFMLLVLLTIVFTSLLQAPMSMTLMHVCYR